MYGCMPGAPIPILVCASGPGKLDTIDIEGTPEGGGGGGGGRTMGLLSNETVRVVGCLTKGAKLLSFPSWGFRSLEREDGGGGGRRLPFCMNSILLLSVNDKGSLQPKL
jgi:hypothetical protein